MADARTRLAAELRNIGAPNELFPLAARSRAEASTADAPGTFLVVHALLLMVARKIEGEPLGEREWHAVRTFLSALADHIVDGGDRTLDLAAAQWRAWTSPAALH